MSPAVKAYYAGRNSVWAGERRAKCPYAAADEAKGWQQGRRDALAEERLSNDPEWDND